MTIQRRQKIRFVECDSQECETVVPLVPGESGPPDEWYTRADGACIQSEPAHYCPACMDRMVEAIRRA